MLLLLNKLKYKMKKTNKTKKTTKKTKKTRFFREKNDKRKKRVFFHHYIRRHIDSLVKRNK